MSVILKIIEKSESAIEEAEILLKANKSNASASRAYYSVYYAARGILLLEDISPKTHQGVLSAFSNHYIKTGIFPRRFSKLRS